MGRKESNQTDFNNWLFHKTYMHFVRGQVSGYVCTRVRTGIIIWEEFILAKARDLTLTHAKNHPRLFILDCHIRI